MEKVGVLVNLLINIVMVILITFCCMFVQAGPDVFAVFGKMIVPFLIVGSIAIELSLYWLMRFAEKYYSN